MKRILAFTLIFAMLFTAMLGVMSSAAQKINENGYTGQTPTLKIEHANVEFGSTVYLLVAVDYYVAGIEYDKDNARPKAEIKVDVTNKAGEVTTLTPDYSYFDNLTQTEKDDLPFKYDSHVVFKYTDLAAKEMADTLTIRAYTADKNNTECDVADHTIEYSVLEYTIKANAAKADAKLLNALDKMLAFGAAAQDAFGYEGDYALADENGAINYGMVLVGGAATRKVIAPVGSLVNPTADTNTFTSEAALYDMSFKTVDPAALTVADGISRYFYYGADVMGDYTKFIKSPAGLNLLTNVSGETSGIQLDYARLLNDLDFSKVTASATTAPLTGIRHTLVTNRTSGIAYQFSTSWEARTSRNDWKIWNLRSHTGALNTYSGASTATLAPGYLHLQTGDATNTDYVSLTNSFTTSTYAMADAENKITVTVALALGDAKTYVAAQFVDSQTTNNGGAIQDITNVPKAQLFYVKNGYMYIEDEIKDENGNFIRDNKLITTLNTVDGEWSASDVTLVHFVLDLNRETVTAYTADGNSVMANTTIATNFFSDPKTPETRINDDTFSLQIKDGDAYISRITISSGDLFN